ncbi:MAG: peptidoglycan DD-metalloendopeptidase family protein [Syntrophomonadales bacterium]|jgi:murein DD-endopeptidase MepM/ murein hydrolase activator NlpD
MAKRTMALVLLVTLALTSWPLPASAGWSRDGFTPCMLSVASDSLVRKYLVKKGDTVWEIARDSNTDVDLILAMNNLTRTSVIQEGQYLDIPGDRQRLYRVKSGDSLWRIARMYQVSVSQLTAANKEIKDPSKLRIGQMINIPSQVNMTTATAAQPSRSINSLFAWPVFGKISSGYGWRKGEFHHGLDIACPVGTPIRAAAAGRVTFVGNRSVYGKTVVVQHANGAETLYAHTSSNLVKVGQQVKKGQVIALVGVTGRTTGPHLHFQINYNDKTLNPLEYLR